MEDAQFAWQLGQEQGVVIGRLITPVTTHESAQRNILCRLNLVRSDEAKPILVPPLCGAEVADLEHGVPDPADMGGAGFNPHRRALARLGGSGVARQVSKG